jgi:membrane-associated phospholipid phosphatase
MSIPSAVLFPAMLVSAVVIVGATVRSLERERRLAFLGEVGLVVAAFFFYFAMRGVTEGGLPIALDHAVQVEDFERAVGISVEPALQEMVLGRDWLLEPANLIYIWAHWPVIGGVALWLYITRPRRYTVMRNAVLISGGIGLVIFWLYPTAPPRIASTELIDTIAERAGYYEGFQPTFLRNRYAAIPSLHVGWSVLVGIALVSESKRLAVRVVGVMVPVLMTWSVIVTGNHYVIDGVIGTALSVGGLGVATRLASRGWPALRPRPSAERG